MSVSEDWPGVVLCTLSDHADRIEAEAQLGEGVQRRRILAFVVTCDWEAPRQRAAWEAPRQHAAELLAYGDAPEDTPILRWCLSDEDPILRFFGALGLAVRGDASGAEELMSWLRWGRSEDIGAIELRFRPWEVWFAMDAMIGLGILRHQPAVDCVLHLYRENRDLVPEFYDEALHTLGLIGGPAAFDYLTERARVGCWRAACALALSGDARAIPFLLEGFLKVGDYGCLYGDYVGALSHFLDDPRVVEALQRQLIGNTLEDTFMYLEDALAGEVRDLDEVYAVEETGELGHAAGYPFRHARSYRPPCGFLDWAREPPPGIHLPERPPPATPWYPPVGQPPFRCDPPGELPDDPMEAFHALPVLADLGSKPVRWLGDLVDGGHEIFLEELMHGACGYLEWDWVPPKVEFLSMDGGVSGWWIRAAWRAAEQLARVGSEAGPNGDAEVWFSWLVYWLSAPHQYFDPGR